MPTIKSPKVDFAPGNRMRYFIRRGGGLLGMQMNLHDSQCYGGNGIVVKGVENTIRAVSTIARKGMRATGSEVLQIMMENE